MDADGEQRRGGFPVDGDAQFLDRSIPVKKAYDDAIIAIYQNGERLMPGNGYTVTAEGGSVSTLASRIQLPMTSTLLETV